MIETKQIKIPTVVYEKMKKSLRFNESFGDWINRTIEQNDQLWIDVRGLYQKMQNMRKSD